MNLQEAGGTWRIMFARLSHLNKAQFAEDIKRYIEMYSKETVSELQNILGSLYG
jgi:hypothetical protein